MHQANLLSANEFYYKAKKRALGLILNLVTI